MHGNHSTRYVRMVNLFGFKDGVKLPCASEKVIVAPLSSTDDENTQYRESHCISSVELRICSAFPLLFCL